MPYKLKGRVIYHKKAGKWSIKQRAKSVASAKRALALLQGLEHGTIKPSEVGRGRFAKKAKRARSAKIRRQVKRTLKLS